MSVQKRVYDVNISRVHPSSLNFLHLDKVSSLPSIVDLRPKMPPVYNQLACGSCSSQSLGAAYEFASGNTFSPSRLFIYYCERYIEHTVSTDSGAMIHDGIRTLQTYGVCPETLWPYDIPKFAVKPPTSCYQAALKHKAVTVHNIKQDITSMKTALANGFPIVVGIQVYASFESDEVAKTGMVPLPDVNNEEALGGHAILVSGYDDKKRVWIMRNSWGADWGDKGYFYLPYEYLLDSSLSSDLWNITKENNLKLSSPQASEPLSLESLQQEIMSLKARIHVLESVHDTTTS